MRNIADIRTSRTILIEDFETSNHSGLLLTSCVAEVDTFDSLSGDDLQRVETRRRESRDHVSRKFLADRHVAGRYIREPEMSGIEKLLRSRYFSVMFLPEFIVLLIDGAVAVRVARERSGIV